MNLTTLTQEMGAATADKAQTTGQSEETMNVNTFKPAALNPGCASESPVVLFLENQMPFPDPRTEAIRG